jgi:ATP-dependent Lhr-like helicase
MLEKIGTVDSTLVFTNTRFQAEIWLQAILKARPDWSGRFALHYGSLNRSERDRAEQGFHRRQ